MGLFEKAGRRFEQFKNETKAAAEEEAEYECVSCETLLYASADRCPECGSEEVVPIDRSNEADSEDDPEPMETGTGDDPASSEDGAE